MATAHGKFLNRRTLIGLLALGAPAAAALAGAPAKLTVRDVVKVLFEARGDQKPDFSHRDLSGLNLADLDFKGADLSHCNLFGVDFTASNLENANLTEAVLDRATLVKTRFSNAILRGTSIRRPSVFSDLGMHARDLPIFREATLAGARITARLDGADFSGADLSDASFALLEERDLGGAPTRGLEHCDFSNARMTRIDMRGLSLSRSVFRNADLSGADLRDCDLSHADFGGAILTEAKFDGAITEGATGLSL